MKRQYPRQEMLLESERQTPMYAIMFYGFERIEGKSQIAEAKVIHISGFKSKLELARAIPEVPCFSRD